MSVSMEIMRLNHQIMTVSWINYQLKNKKAIIKSDTFKLEDIKYVGGLDISFDKKDNTKGCAYLTIMNFDTNEIVYGDHLLCKMTIPYVPGFLGFREIPHYKKLINKIIGKPFFPQILLIDGFGILHQREFGSACHIGYELGIPTIGVAKTLLSVDGLHENNVKKEFKEKCHKKGDFIDLIGTSNQTWGVALKSNDNAVNPIYVSIGHMISLETAKNVVLKTCIYKNPEPIRISDIKSKHYL